MLAAMIRILPKPRQPILPVLASFLLFTGLFTGPVAADNYNLADRLFAVTAPGLKTVRNHFEVPVKSGKGQVKPLAISGTWRIYGGTVLPSKPRAQRPILVELSGTVGKQRKLIARVLVRYYPTKRGWQPMYQMKLEPVMVKTPSGWQPLFDSPDSPELLDITNRQQHPTPAGYRPYLDFRMYRSKVSIDSWVIKDQS